MYWIFRAFTVFVMKTFFRLRVEGAENLPKKTNFIVVANHTSLMDPIIVGAAISKRVYWIALRDLYRISWLAWVMKKASVVPTGNSSDKAVDLVMQNLNLCVFAEGGISRDGRLREFRRGAALLALRTGRPIVPCAILGSHKALPRTSKFPRLFRSIRVKIGVPVYLLKEFDDIIDDIYLQEGTYKIRKAIEEMLYA
jgi:1-acyl-sn-glycerol-3-phosphate acyltransferase